MGIFNLSNKREEGYPILWNALNDSAQIEEIKKESKDKPVFLLKHSTRCGISSMALSRLEKEWPISSDEAKAYYLDLLAYREVSNQVAEEFGVEHQSPQVLVIKEGVCTYDASHSEIEWAILKKEL